uniref:Uncharacterized protein n=1 Tax=Panagrolaimus sp. JU765 TaxID=591449 RepID=A0AC34QKY5_9BILA
MSYCPQTKGGTPGWNDPPADIGTVKHPHLNRRARPVDPSCKGVVQPAYFSPQQAAYGQGFAAQGYDRQRAVNQQFAVQQQVNRGFTAHQAQLAGYGQSNRAGFQVGIQTTGGIQNPAQLTGFQQNSGLQQPNSAEINRNSAGYGSGQLVGHGYGNCHVAPADIQAQYYGKQALNAQTGAAIPPGNVNGNIYTANPGAAGYADAGANREILGNNTAGYLTAHRNAVASNYACDRTGHAH